MSARFLKPFAELGAAPRGLWFVMGAFVFEAPAYFGILTLMTVYFSHDLHLPDKYASMMVSMFTMLVTLFMLGVGSFAESFGLRRAIALALLLCTAGRAVYCLLPGIPGLSAVAVAAVLSLLLVAAGEGILQPTCYSGVKQFTDERTSSLGYAMIYALMNLGIVAVGALSAWVRPGVQAVLDQPAAATGANPLMRWLASFCGSGVQAVNWLCCGLTGITLLGFLLLMTRKAEAARLRPDVAPAAAAGPKPSPAARLRSYLSEGPFGNTRFLFFIFMLLPVRTLFAHQWLTMPEYILRSYPPWVGDKMEWLVNWINPLIIFVGVPLATVLTRRFHVYTMMVVGSLVSAAPTFLLRQRAGSAGPRRAVHGIGPGPLVAGQGDNRAVLGLPAGHLLSAQRPGRAAAHRPAVADLRLDRHALARRALVGAGLGPTGLAPNRTPGKSERG